MSEGHGNPYVAAFQQDPLRIHVLGPGLEVGIIGRWGYGVRAGSKRRMIVQCRAALSLSWNWAMPVGGSGGNRAEQREGAGLGLRDGEVRSGLVARMSFGQRPSQDSGLLSPCSPVQYRHAVSEYVVVSLRHADWHIVVMPLLSSLSPSILLQRVAGPPANGRQRPCSQANAMRRLWGSTRFCMGSATRGWCFCASANLNS